jgi:hypothetical protein
MRVSLGQKSRPSTTIWDYASTPRHLPTSASTSPTKLKWNKVIRAANIKAD